jgi:arabinose-5-phosphate isomerase
MSAVVTAVSDVEVARSVLGTEAAGLHSLAASLDRSFDRAIDLIAACTGRVVASGMGKSGHVARKVAATLASTGSPAIFVHPAEASHGDLGMVQPGDALLLFSNSGETTELADLVAHARRFGLPLIAVTGRAGSTLATAADVALVLPRAPEACAVTSAPTTSTTMQMALGDALAVVLLNRRGFTASDFQSYHPGGRLGARLRRVHELMHQGDAVPLAEPGMPMQQALLLMTGKGFGCVGVVEAGRLIGIVTDGDLRRAMGPGLLDQPVRAVMTAAPRTIRPDALAADALREMNDGGRRITSLFVVDAGAAPIGILHIHDLLRAGIA